MYRLALELLTQAPLLIEVESKAARGRRLRSCEAPAATRAAELALVPDASALDGLCTIIAARLGELLGNQPAAVAGVAEGVHQMRIAIRRLRTAFALFKPHLEPRTTGRFAAELKRLGRVLGEARDWDVFCLETLPEALRGQPGAAWEPVLREAAEAERCRAHCRVREEFARPALTSLTLGMAAWLEDGRAEPKLVGDGRLERPITATTSPLLGRSPARSTNAAGRSKGAPARSSIPCVRR